MTYFETPEAREAHMRGMTLDAFSDLTAALEQEADLLDSLGYPHLEPEDRPIVSESDFDVASEQDRADLDAILAWEEFEGFHG